MQMAKYAVVAMALGLAGCSTPMQRAERMQAEMAEAMAIYGPACTRLGYAMDTDQWRDCVLQLSTREEMERSGPSYYGAWGPRPWRFGGYWGPYW